MSAPRSVDEYLAKLPPRDRAALEKLRATIKAAAPGATEIITYRMPGLKAHGRALVSYAAFSDHYSLFPMGVSVIDANKPKLEPYLSGKSTLRFSFDKPLPVSIVRLVVKARLAQNAARSAPAARRTSTKHGGRSAGR